jgi:hypothetical protein
MLTGTRLLSGALLHLACTAGLIAVETAALHAQAPLPAGPLKVMTWHPHHPSMAGKTFAEFQGQSAAAATIPLWTGTDSGYTFMMVGTDPTVAQTAKGQVSTIPTKVIPVKFIFPSHTFDPTKADKCTSKPAVTMVENSPIFKTVDLTVGGTFLGTVVKGRKTPLQFESLFQRANFWAFTAPGQINPNYEVNITYGAEATQTETAVTVTALGGQIYNGPCDPLGEIEVNAWDSLAVSIIEKLKIPATTLPIFLFYNVVMYDTTPNNCCILGYHSSFVQENILHTYAVVDYDESGAFGSSVQNTTVMSHEIAEWMNDPTGANPTPAWGNIGQVSGCQANLEVGDPLSGTLEIPSDTATVYRVQDLAFKSWFYHDSPSIGANGWYSLFGTFRSSALPCP